jgi:hypothetical protein
MYRYQAKHKILSILLVMFFPSQASANAGVWEWPPPIIVSDFVPGICEFVEPPMTVQKVVIELADIGQIMSSFDVELYSETALSEVISLEYVVNGSWSSLSGHTVTDLGLRVEVSLDTPLPDVYEVCVEYYEAVPAPEIIIDLLQLVPPPSEDFGDAPDPTYPTLLASNGARHQITGPFMGVVVDGEPDGQPTATADGDDLNNDDEDGVTFTTLLVPGNTANISVVTSAAGLLDAWVDFNINGGWSDAGEQVFTNQPLVAGANNLSFGVPAGASPGSTFVRFRVSSNGGLSFDGPAPDGEVEDYQVLISELQPGSISGMKWNDIDGNSQKDAGEPGISGWIIRLTDEDGNDIAETTTDANGEYTFGSLGAGPYHVSEVQQAGWTQTFPPGGTHAVQVIAGLSLLDVDFGNTEGEPLVEVGGDVYPVNKVAMVAPWLALAAVLIVGTTIVIRRRRATG